MLSYIHGLKWEAPFSIHHEAVKIGSTLGKAYSLLNLRQFYLQKSWCLWSIVDFFFCLSNRDDDVILLCHLHLTRQWAVLFKIIRCSQCSLTWQWFLLQIPDHCERLYNSGYKVITEALVVFKKKFFLGWISVYDMVSEIASYLYQFGKTIVFVPVVIILGILSASEIADCKVKLTLLQVRVGLRAITHEVCREGVAGSAWQCRGACNGLRGPNREQRDLFAQFPPCIFLKVLEVLPGVNRVLL